MHVECDLESSNLLAIFYNTITQKMSTVPRPEQDDDDSVSTNSTTSTTSTTSPSIATSFAQHPSSYTTITCPPDTLPGELVQLKQQHTNTTHNTPASFSIKASTSSKRKTNRQTPNKYVAIPTGIKPGEQFHVPLPLTTGQIKQVLLKNTAPGLNGELELTLTRSLLLQEVHGIFVDVKATPSPLPPSLLASCFTLIQCCAATSCLHPLCFGLGCSQLSTNSAGREFLLKDGHGGNQDFLYLLKERNIDSCCCSLHRGCYPNHSFTMEAYRVLPLDDTGTNSSAVLLQPDIKRGPEFSIVRPGYCCLSGCVCVKECRQKFVVHDRNVVPGSVAPGTVLGLGYQQCCGGSPCYDCTPEAMLCCTPTMAVMRRDTVMTANGWGSTDRVLGMLEGPCCCYDGFCCRRRNKHWFFSQTPGKAYDVGAFTFNKKGADVPTSMRHLRIGGSMEMTFKKRNLSNVDKKLMASTMVALKYIFLRDWWQGACLFNFHCCGANVQC